MDLPSLAPDRHRYAINRWVLLGASALLQWIPGIVLNAAESTTDARPSIAPDIREDQTRLKMQNGNFVIVPIPISNPTLGTGLVAGGAYFYAQTDEQEKVQPASVSAVAAMYTSNYSRALAFVQQNYWKQDRWRFTGAVGAADLRLSLLAPDENAAIESLDWRVDGQFFLARLSRRLAGDWYGGAFTRVVDANQGLEFEVGSVDFDTADVRSIGLGLTLEFDSRDMPINTFTGRYSKIEGLFNDEVIGSNETYQSYSIEYRSYQEWSDSVVFAWEVHGCQRIGTVPLWDSCVIALRGFPVTNYLGLSSYYGQAEARWRVSRRWGLVAFGGAGEIGNSADGIASAAPPLLQGTVRNPVVGGAVSLRQHGPNCRLARFRLHPCPLH